MFYDGRYITHDYFLYFLHLFSAPPGGFSGECVGLRTWWSYFHLSPLQKHERKVVGGFGKKSCVSTSVRKPGNTYASPTAMI